jgi:hypothetical protein
MCGIVRSVIISLFIVNLVACSDSERASVQSDSRVTVNRVSAALVDEGFNLAQKVAYSIWTPVNDANSVHSPPYLQQADFAFITVLAELSKVWSYEGTLNPPYTVSVSGLGSRNGRVVVDFDDYAFTDVDLRLLDGRVTLSMDFRDVYEEGPELTNWYRFDQVQFHNLLVSGAQAFFVDGTLKGSSPGPYQGTTYDVSITNAITRELVTFENLDALYVYEAPNYFGEPNYVSGSIDFGEQGAVSLSPTEVAYCEVCDQNGYFAVEMSFSDSVDAFKVFKPSIDRVRISSDIMPFDLLLDDSNLLGAVVEHVEPEIGTIRFVQSDLLKELLIDPVSVEDADGDAFVVAYKWQVNGMHVPAADNSLSLGREHYVGGDNVEIRVFASDEFHTSERSLNMVVPNSLPILDEELFSSPLSLVVGESIELDVSSAFDVDGEDLSYGWSVRGHSWRGGDGISFAPSNSSPVVMATAVSQGEYTVNLRINDSEGSILKYGTVNIEAMDIFDERYDIEVPGSDLELVLIEDVSGDGRKDVVVGMLPGSSSYGEAGILVYVQQSDGTLASPRFYGAGFTSHAYYMYSIDSGDFNGDGRTDIVTTHQDGVAIWYQNSAGSMSGPVIKKPFGVKNLGSELVAGDFNGDLQDDILSFPNPSYSELFKQYDDNSLSSSIPVRLGLGDYSSPTKIAKDIDNDGLVDIVTWSNDQARQIHAYELTDGGIEHRVLYDFGDDVPQGTLQVADINGDGLQDILINASKSTEQLYVIAVLLQDEANGFQLSQEMDFYISNGIDQIETGDFNGDGRMDIAAVTGGHYSINIYLQLEDGSFMSKQTYPVTFNLGDKGKLSVGDINSDGKDDAVIVNSSTLHVYYGK